MSNTELVKIFDGIKRWRSPATMNVQTKGSGKQQFIAFLGYDGEGKAVRRSLGMDKDRAYGELAKINQLIAERQFKDAPNVFEVATALEVRAAQKKLEGFGVSLMQAVDFFLIHHRPASGHLTVEEAGLKFVEYLKRNGRSDAYVHQYEKVYLTHFNEVFGKKRLIDVTQEDAENFIFKTKATTNSVTKSEYIGKMRVFFNAMAELGYYHKDLNPFEKVKKPQASRDEKSFTERDRCLPMEDVAVFLDYLSKNQLWDILAIHALVMFCGVRMDEALRLSWNEILFDRAKVDLGKKAAKKRRRRVLDIPRNALAMLAAAKTGMNDRWVIRSKNAFKLKMKRIKSDLRAEKAKGEYAYGLLDFHTNFARVSFASYSYALYGAEKTAEAMGHADKVYVLHTNYKEIVDKDMAQCYFQFRPLGVSPYEQEEEQQIEIRTITP